ncbi:amino acid adenylation domain-containing protein [Pseudoalteromonas piscicida]|uniref:amino acid adenylation domain-containing protein n=1 Tax=Pseudoalteromonas piscicida TaxID=43662 RepID=UPI003C79D76F
MSINALLAARKGNMTLAQKKAMLKQLEDKQPVQSSAPVIKKLGKLQAPLSAAQQRLWFEWLINPENTAYHLGGGMCLSGHLDKDALRASLDHLAERHAGLRTQFVEGEGAKPAQVVLPTLRLPLESVEQHELAAEVAALQAHDTELSREQAQEQVYKARLARFAKTPFDLRTGPLMRMQWLQFAPEQHVLLVVMHHIISDAWSKSLIIKDFVEIYQKASLAQPITHDANRLDYTDFAQWQNDWLNSDAEQVQQQWQFWQQQLTGSLPVVELGVTNSANSVPKAEQLVTQLPAQLAAQVTQFAREQGVSLFVVLLTAYQALLHRYTNEDELLTAVPVANRNQFATHNVVGFFVNIQLMRLPVAGELTLQQLLRNCAKQALAIQAQQDIPIDSLMKRFQPNLQGATPYQVMFNHLKDSSSGLAQLHGASLTNYFSLTQGIMCDLALDTTELSDGGVQLQWRVDSNKLSTAWISTFDEQYQSLLRTFCQAPETQIRDLLLNSAERKAALAALESGGKTSTSLLSVPQAFALQAQKTPDAIALRFAGESVTYAELQQRVNQLAQYLVAQNISHESKVALLFERSIEMVVAMLATLQAGAAYVPIEPQLPEARLHYIIEQSACACILSHAPVKAQLAENICAQVTWLEHIELSAYPTTAPNVTIHLDNLAYVIYTSGSTGKPKGVACVHRGVANRLAWGQTRYQLQGSDRVLQKTPFGFDVSIWEFFWPLTQGASLVLAAPEQHKEPSQIRQLIETEAVTVCHFVPSMLQAFMTGISSSREALGGKTLCPSLRQVFTSGEMLTLQTQQQFFSYFEQTALHNLYGPTETAIEVTSWQCHQQDDVIPIGKPISGVQAYVLDGALNQVPIGVAGELYLAGECLARGYLSRPDLSADRFVANPFADSNSQGARMYRTGDKVVWNDEGQLEFLGRLDQQVKIRGLRIELGEIESQLRQLANVVDAAVLVKSSVGGEQLVAYLVLANDAELEPDTLNSQLTTQLPQYMLPSVFVQLEKLPLTVNGKLDRKALPEPSLQQFSTFAAPQGEIESGLAEIWQQVLQLEKVGRDDNFFALGGHSLLAVETLSQIQAQFGVDIAVRDAFANPILKDLAAIISAQTNPEQEDALLDLEAFMENL